MPALIQVLTDPVSLAMFGLYAGLLAWESLFPARRLPAVPGWQAKGVVCFALYFLLSTYLPLLWSEALGGLCVVDLSGAGTLVGVLIATLIYEGFVYVWHRAMHASHTLFRIVHQLHHSAERIDVAGAFFMSPLDMAGWTALFSLALAFLGLSPGQVTGTVLLTTFLSIFQHANVRTPRWLGYFVQRPESHSHHHARGVHANNYSDLPILDLLLGTFHNPEDFAAHAGFWDGASARVQDMLLGRDVSNGELSSEPLAPNHAPVTTVASGKETR